jgi:hypothetical protein
MLHNPAWDKPSLEGFRVWLEKQPKEKVFEYSDSRICAVGQYFQSLGLSWGSPGSLTTFLNSYASLASLKAASLRRPVTFGDVLAEIEAKAPKT